MSCNSNQIPYYPYYPGARSGFFPISEEGTVINPYNCPGYGPSPFNATCGCPPPRPTYDGENWVYPDWYLSGSAPTTIPSFGPIPVAPTAIPTNFVPPTATPATATTTGCETAPFVTSEAFVNDGTLTSTNCITIDGNTYVFVINIDGYGDEEDVWACDTSWFSNHYYGRCTGPRPPRPVPPIFPEVLPVIN